VSFLSRRALKVVRLAILVGLLALPPTALGHGDEAGGEVEQLAMQPARVLAQQALSTLRIRNDTKEAAVRLDAALKSKDKSGIDVARLRRATETLDAGRPKAAIPLLDAALSRPLGSDRGKALHEAGREFSPGTGAQEVVGIVLGLLLIAIGAAALWRTRGRRPAKGPEPPVGPT
jgi:hypothetical protein